MKVIPKEALNALKIPNYIQLEKTEEGINRTVNGKILESRKIDWNKGHCITCTLPLEVVHEDILNGYVKCSFCYTVHQIERFPDEIQSFAESSVPKRTLNIITYDEADDLLNI
jgi:hypothetical protein